MAEPAVTAAAISAVGVAAAAFIAWLMNLSVRSRAKEHEHQLARVQADLRSTEERLRSSLARELASHESRLRIEAEMKLRSHDRSWSLLREVAIAVHVCREKIDNFAGAIRIDATLKTVQIVWEEAAASVAKFESLCVASPPEASLGSVSEAFHTAYADLGDAMRLQSQRKAFLEKSSENVQAALEKATSALAIWNRRLWEGAETLSVNEVKDA